MTGLTTSIQAVHRLEVRQSKEQIARLSQGDLWGNVRGQSRRWDAFKPVPRESTFEQDRIPWRCISYTQKCTYLHKTAVSRRMMRKLSDRYVITLKLTNYFYSDRS